MCGIAGILPGRSGVDPDVGPMVERLRHRGPDDSGIWMSPDGKACLGHTRLSVLDPTSAGHQPMVSGDGQTALVYNGETYNYPDLRREVGGSGKLSSSCDTEAILHLYLRDGIGA